MRRFGLIGRPLGHSASAKYFTEKFRKEGLSDCEYALYELPSVEELPSLLGCDAGVCGLNVTIPYKRSVMHLLDRHRSRGAGHRRSKLHPPPAERNAGGPQYRHRPDCAPHSTACWAGPNLRRRWWLARGRLAAVQYALAERGIPFALVSRDAAKGNYTYDNLPCEAVAESRLIVNASPVGTYPAVGEAPRIPYAYITPEHFLLDLVYNPPLTRFLDCGLRRGARVLNGETMFRGQAEASWRIWNT